MAEKRKLESDICEKDAKISKLTNSASHWRKPFKNVGKNDKGSATKNVSKRRIKHFLNIQREWTKDKKYIKI